MKKNKLALFQSVVSLLLCISMLVSTTFAWFTDSVTTGINTIAAGNLDVELYHSNAAVTDERVDSSTMLFMDLQGQPILWEPGVMSYENLRVTNAGDLALVYQLALNTANENFVIDPTTNEQHGLSEVLKVGVVEDGITATDRASVVASVEAANWTTLADFVREGSLLPEDAGVFEKTWGIVIYWEPGDNDNFWNLNNGKTLSEGETLNIDLGVSLIATQEQYESDAFGSDYDADAKDAFFPAFVSPGTVTVQIATNANNEIIEPVVMQGGQVTATIPAGVKVTEGTTELTMTVTEMAASGANITLGENEAMLSLDVHIEGIAADNAVPMTIELAEVAPTALNMGNYKLYHVENSGTNEMTLVDEFDAHNQFQYDPAAGDITLYMATFSEVAMVAKTTKAWEGAVDHSWYNTDATELTIANADQLWSFSQIVGGMADGNDRDSFSGKTVKLVNDINLGDDEENNNTNIIFYPIGYYNSEETYEKTENDIESYFMTFEGTFDGQGHTISNFYQNTWEMKGDNEYYSSALQYYRDGMGLFGKVYGGTVKNLTVSNFSSDGEYTTTGVIAAYADSASGKPATFENIAIVSCNPRVYNIGNGGIVGCVGWYSRNESLETDGYTNAVTFKNITVDKTNKISALWGSYDVACGGIVGQYYPNSGCGVKFENCHVAGQIDVYNDVCGNYQYYAYRYAGMMIGSIRENETINGNVYPKMDGITATGCTVHYDTWNDYFYCELQVNGKASYTHDYKFSRLTEVDSVDVSNKTVTVAGTTTAIPTSGRYNYVVVDGEYATENATCYHFVDGAVWNHLDAGKQTVNGEEIDVEDHAHIYLPFTQLFTGYGWGVTSKGVSDYAGIETMDITYSEQNASEVKFATKFTGDFLYRVGNLNAVSLSSLFKAVEGATINKSGVYVTIDKVDEDMNVGGSFTPSTTDYWYDGTIQFTGTGVVKVTIQDYMYCTPTELIVEVVDAYNATTALSAPYTYNGVKYNVVLLNDCGFSSLEVSDGYALYGNGFTMTCGSDLYAVDRSYAFVSLVNGTLDNVQVICPNFSNSILYDSNKTENDNPSYTDSNGRTRYYNIRSAVMMSGNSKIKNSYISGGRAAVYALSGNPLIENTTIVGGAAANIHVERNNNLKLKDITLIQKPIQATVHDTTTTVMGVSVILMCDSNGVGAPITLEGKLRQYAWANEDYEDYVPSDAKSLISTALEKTDFIHSITYEDGITRDSVNLGFVYMPDGYIDTYADNMSDQRDEQQNNTVYYETVRVSKAAVYTYKNTNGTHSDIATQPGYASSTQENVLPSISFSDANEDRVFTTAYDATNGWMSTLSVDVDAGTYSFSFDKLLVQKYGKNLNYTVAYADGASVDKSNAISLTSSGSLEFVLTITDDQVFDQSGNLTGETVTHTYTFMLVSTKTSINPPTLNTTSKGSTLLVGEKGWSGTTWNIAISALENIQVTYWSKDKNDYVTEALSSLCDVSALSGLQNTTGENNSTWTYSGSDFTLSIEGGTGKSGAYTKPVVVDNVLYFVVESAGLCNTDTTTRSITLTYTFTDSNQQSTDPTAVTWNHTYDSEETMYDHSKFIEGTKTKADTCFAPDTLITLADGTQKEIQDVRVGDQVQAWNFYTGQYDVVPVSLLQAHSTGVQNILHLYFADGTELKILGEHGVFDADLNTFVFIDEEDVMDYVGHSFVKQDGDGFKTVKLTGYEVTTEHTTAYTILSYGHYNVMAEGMFTVTPAHVGDNFFNPFDIGEDMKYDEEDVKADIQKYGLYTYKDFAHVLTREQFYALNLGHFKVSVGKGYVTYDGLIYLIENFINNEDFNVN